MRPYFVLYLVLRCHPDSRLHKYGRILYYEYDFRTDASFRAPRSVNVPLNDDGHRSGVPGAAAAACPGLHGRWQQCGVLR